jgi:hypothetical protein
MNWPKIRCAQRQILLLPLFLPAKGGVMLHFPVLGIVVMQIQLHPHKEFLGVTIQPLQIRCLNHHIRHYPCLPLKLILRCNLDFMLVY